VFVIASLQMETVKASDNIADYLWNESKSFQQAASNSAFVQGLKNVSLNPSDFGINVFFHFHTLYIHVIV
jgi:hypothetical protein